VAAAARGSPCLLRPAGGPRHHLQASPGKLAGYHPPVVPTRRNSLKLLAAGASLPVVGRLAAAGKVAGNPHAAAFMEKYGVPGLSYAIARDGKFIAREACGMADLEEKRQLTTDHSFRIASVSKPLTAVAIFLLVERGKLTLDQHVFGKGGALGGMAGPAGITIRHILTHTCGGWKNDGKDPMFKHPDYNHAKLIAWTLKNQAPTGKPGENYAYSNFGYCLLGRIIEQAGGSSYEDFVRKNVLIPAGAAKMQVARGSQLDRFPGEVNYYTNRKTTTFAMNVRRMDAHGGWVGTPTELVKFALHVDGFARPADLLRKSSLESMTARTGPNPDYACGWLVNKAGNWWHNGSLPGLSSLLVRTSKGHCWAACANTRAEGIGLALDRLMWKIVRGS